MKTKYLYVLLVLCLICFKAEATNDTILISPDDTIIVVCHTKEVTHAPFSSLPTCLCEDSNKIFGSEMHPDDISTLTLAVNTVNDVLSDMNTLFTVVTIILSVITVLVAVVGLLGIHDIKKDVEKHKKDVGVKIDNLINEAETLKKRNKTIEKAQKLNNQYLQKVNQWMLKNAYSIANTNGGKSVQSQNSMEESMLSYYLMKLLLSKDHHEIDGCINYIKTKGTLNEIEHLQFIVDNDLDKYKRDKASEAIGYIRGRFS